MARSPRQKSRSGIYHIIYRGVNRQTIFHDDQDRKTLLNKLRKYKTEAEMDIYSWCLMDNHFHLLVKEGKNSLSTTMKKLAVSYVYYYHCKYESSGHLFQDRYRSEVVESSLSFVRVLRYIHQNPVKAGLVPAPADWQWSSCRALYNETVYGKSLLDHAVIMQAFKENNIITPSALKKFNETFNPADPEHNPHPKSYKRLTDQQAAETLQNRLAMKQLSDLKTFSPEKRKQILSQVEEVKFMSRRQLGRIIGISPRLL